MAFPAATVGELGWTMGKQDGHQITDCGIALTYINTQCPQTKQYKQQLYGDNIETANCKNFKPRFCVDLMMQSQSILIIRMKLIRA